MNRRLIYSLIALVLVWVAFAAYVTMTAGQLPDRVATHFGASGQPDGWMTRAEHVRFTVISGLLVPGFVLGIFMVIGRFPNGALNIAHKEYWLAPERREETLTFVRLQGVRFAGMFIAFLAAIHWSILVANRHSPVVLRGSHVGWIAGIFVAASAVWVILFVLRFLRRPS